MATQLCSLSPTTPSIFLKSKGNKRLTLEEITNLILMGDEDCVNDLLETIRDSMNATHLSLHVQIVTKLHSKCFIMRGLLIGKNFKRKNEIMQTFRELETYAEVDLVSKLH